MAEAKSVNDSSDRRQTDAKGNGSARLIAYMSILVAGLSLVTSFYNGYLNTKFVELIQTSVERNETVRTCKELIDAYFQVKLRTAQLAGAIERERNPSAAPVIAAEAESANSVSRFAALGTYLANYYGHADREKYTHLSWELERVISAARSAAPSGVDKLFEKANAMFDEMNNDCVRAAQRRN
jgi:hypothetical protein